MSLTNSIRGLSEEAAAEFLRNRRLPEKTFTEGVPGDPSWLKRQFMEARHRDRQQDEWEDLTWSILDPGTGCEW